MNLILPTWLFLKRKMFKLNEGRVIVVKTPIVSGVGANANSQPAG